VHVFPSAIAYLIYRSEEFSDIAIDVIDFDLDMNAFTFTQPFKGLVVRQS
jgi:hypothetical protein